MRPKNDVILAPKQIVKNVVKKHINKTHKCNITIKMARN